MTMKQRSLAVWKALTSAIGPDEILLLLGLGLVTAALWPLAAQWVGSGLPALLPAGLVVLWVSLPSRAPMIVRTLLQEKPPRRTP